MQTKELVLRTLHLNLLPSPRVISPGPATGFPVIYASAGGTETLVDSLRQARGIAQQQAPAGFFLERLPVQETAQVAVLGSSVRRLRWPSLGCSPYLPAGVAELGVRAAYCLGFRNAAVDVGIGPGGPWVLDVSETRRTEQVDEEARVTGAPHAARPRAPAFLGARAEYVRVDPVTGRPQHTFYTLDMQPGAEKPLFPPDFKDPSCVWISSPMPFPEMPLTTRLLFKGPPDPDFLWLLDTSLAIVGMLASPVEEARERHATPEGLLGSTRPLRPECFEYLCVPSLLWDPRAAAGMVALARAVTVLRDAIMAAPGPWRSAGLEERYRTQRAYYRGDKESLKPALDAIRGAVTAAVAGGVTLPIGAPVAAPQPVQPHEVSLLESLFELAAAGGLASTGPVDIRHVWGIDVHPSSARHVVLGPAACWADDGRDRAAAKDVLVVTGSKEAPVPPGNVVPRDPIEEGPLPSWAGLQGAVTARPNPALAGDLDLPGDMTYRATLTAPGIPAQHRPAEAGRAHRLRIGPLLGIMAPLEQGPRRFGIETDRFREILRIAASDGILAYVFFPGDASPGDSGGDSVTGWLYRERMGWFRAKVPIPDVVYDRYIPDVLPAGVIRDVAREFQEDHPATVFLNSLELVRACRDKLLAHRILSLDAFVAAHLPETVLAEDAVCVARFAAARERTYLKLRGGTGSRGLVLVEKVESSGRCPSFKVSRRGADGSTSEVSALDEAGLARRLATVLHPAEGPAWQYIAQHGVDLARVPGAGEAFEARVICQKGGAGAWLRTGMVCRMNPSQGRFIVPLEELHAKVDDVLEQVFPGRVREIKESIRELGRRLPPLLEAASGRGGEMSVDLGIDSSGNVWLIEVNSKPATLFRDIAAFRLRDLSLRRLVNYAAYLFASQEQAHP